MDLVVILGPTATGKTRVGVHLARRFHGEIISADSRQVYRGMDLGTGKDLDQYGEVPYHLIDLLDPQIEEFDVFQFQRRCYAAIEEIRGRRRLPLVVGGTGLYLEAILLGYRMVEAPKDSALGRDLAALDDDALARRLRRLRPEQHNTTDLSRRERMVRAIEIAEATTRVTTADRQAPPISPAIFGLRVDPASLRRRITARLRQRLDEGMIDEVRALLAAGVDHRRLDDIGLEYRFVALHLRGTLNRNDMFQKLNAAIHRFAKRQRTFFRRMERRGLRIEWVDGERSPEQAIEASLKGALDG